MTFDQNRFSHGGLSLVITDSGLGGLSICAEVERSLRAAGRAAHITYFNAWPQEGQGYNDLPDITSRARVFDRALARMARFRPNQILIACNTLSIVYEVTQHRGNQPVPVLGIIDAGVDLFCEALDSDPASVIVLTGTRTTIESGVHRQKLVSKGIAPNRITAVACPGLAAAIETDPSGSAVSRLIDKCATEACTSGFAGDVLYCGFCCTHYTYVAGQIISSLERASGKKVRALDPKDRLMRFLRAWAAEPADAIVSSRVTIEVISKVRLDENSRRAIAEHVEPVSPATAKALMTYTHEADLF